MIRIRSRCQDFLIRRGASFKENPQSVSPYSADIAKYFFLFRQIKDEELEDEDYKKVQSLLEKEDILAPGQIRIRDVLKREVKNNYNKYIKFMCERVNEINIEFLINSSQNDENSNSDDDLPNKWKKFGETSEKLIEVLKSTGRFEQSYNQDADKYKSCYPKINISNFIRDFNLLKKTNEGETKFFEIDTENVLSFSECYIIIDKLFLKLKGMNAEEKRKEGITRTEKEIQDDVKDVFVKLGQSFESLEVSGPNSSEQKKGLV